VRRLTVRAIPMRSDARPRYREWVSRAPAGELVAALLDRHWPEPETLGTSLAWRIEGDDLAGLRAAAVAAIEAAGGRVELGTTVAMVVGGELRISMA
jgi:hypothetical protein